MNNLYIKHDCCRIGRNASAEVIIELVKKKCLPLLLYASEVLPFNSSDFKSFDYAINCAIRKIFLTNSNEVVLYCREIFGIASARDIVSNRLKVFVSRFAKIGSLLSMS